MTKSLLAAFILNLSISSQAQEYDSIRTSLEDFLTMSNSHRSHVMDVIKKYGRKSHQFDSLNAAITHTDSLALIFVIAVLETHGWLGKKEIGEKANYSLFLAIQHAEHAHRKKYFSLLKQSVIISQSDKHCLVLMEDRILCTEGKKQEYGTQYDYNEKNVVTIFPVRDVKHLDKRRKDMGLPSLKKQFGNEKFVILE